MKVALLSLLISVVVSALCGCTPTQPQVESPTNDPHAQEEISYLIELFDRSDVRLVLNNEEFRGKGAVSIMQSKYDHYSGEIHSAEDFIRICATSSNQLGNPMVVKTKKGDHPLNQWLSNKLDFYRKHHT